MFVDGDGNDPGTVRNIAAHHEHRAELPDGMGETQHRGGQIAAQRQRGGHGEKRIHGRGANKRKKVGYTYLHGAVDDHSRVAFGCLHPDERGISACRALLQAVRYYRSLGVRFERVLTDNGACYKSRCFRRLLRRLGIRHLRTRPYTPRTNGKAERLVQTTLREWAYALPYRSADSRAADLPRWITFYNQQRPHAGIGGLAPATLLRPAT